VGIAAPMFSMFSLENRNLRLTARDQIAVFFVLLALTRPLANPLAT
jgi:hypothetical protein